MTRVPQTTRQILNTIQQLEVLQTTLRSRVKGVSAGENLKLRKVTIDVGSLIDELDKIAGRMSVKTGASVQDVKTKLAAEAERRRSGQIRSKEPCEQVSKAAASADLKGCMVALYPLPEVAKKIAVEGGEAPERLHLTVIYFKDKAADRNDWADVGRIVENTAQHHAALHGSLVGTGRFVNDKGEVAIAEVDIPGLLELREELVARLEEAGFPISTDHLFHPHVTLKYNEADEPFPDTDLLVESVPLDVWEIRVVQGEEVLGSYPFDKAA